MKAALFNDIKSIQMIEKSLPELNKDDVLVKVNKTGICGSDIHAYMGSHPFRKPPSILGHELVGEVKEIGRNVVNFTIGDRVTVEPQIGCEKCDMCLQGLNNLCDSKIVLGTDNWDGSFAEFISVPEKTLYKIPQHMSSDEAVLIEPLAVGVHAANLAKVKKGDKVAILGSGPIGLLTAVAVKSKGAKTICLTDAVDYNLETGKKLGATDIVNITNNSITEYAKQFTGRFDHVFLTAGVNSIIEEALNIVKKRGNIITIALFNEEIQFDVNKVMLSELRIIGSSMYIKRDFEESINILSSKEYKVECLLTHRFKLDEVEKGIKKSIKKEGDPLKIIIDIKD